MNVNLYNTFLTAEPFVTKLGMVEQHHGPECHVIKLVCNVQGQGHIDSLRDSII